MNWLMRKARVLVISERDPERAERLWKLAQALLFANPFTAIYYRHVR